MTASSPRPAKTRSEIGRSANARGKSYERQLATYLRTWWPEAERAVAVGFAARGAQRASADPGDVRGVPDTIWDCKSRSVVLSHAERASMSEELGRKAVLNDKSFAILVERRERCSVSEWHAVLDLSHAARLAAGPFGDVSSKWCHTPVMLRLGDVVALLRRFGI